MKTFLEAKKELADSVKVSKKGTKICSFSRSDFESLAQAWLNDVNYTMTDVDFVDGKLVTNSHEVVRNFRNKFIKPILVDFGVPKEDAERFVEEYKFKLSQTQPLYDFVADILYQYMDAGKKFNFHTKEDFIGSIRMADVAEEVKETELRDMKDRSKVLGKKKEKRDAHKVIKAKKQCPEWKKHVL